MPNHVRHEIGVSALDCCEKKCIFVLFLQYDPAVFTFSGLSLKPWPTDGAELSVGFSAFCHPNNDGCLSDKRQHKATYC